MGNSCSVVEPVCVTNDVNVDVVTDVDTMGPAVTVNGVANPNSERVVSMYGDKP